MTRGRMFRAPLLLSAVMLFAAVTFSSAEISCDVNCAAGEYGVKKADDCGWECAPCPGGFKCRGGPCTNPNHPPEACATGEYSTGGTDTCLDCPDGEYSPFEGASACIDCSAGYFCDSVANGGTTEPQSCDPGTFSAARASACTSCGVGEYVLTSAATACLTCPAGSFCVDSTSSPTTCPDGEFQNATGQTSCVPCPLGSSCLDPSLSPVQCPDGTFSGQGTQGCESCPPGMWCTGGQNFTCSAGEYSGHGFVACLSCPSGQYAQSEGSSACQLCPDGSECNATHVIGSCADAGGHALEGTATCTTCAAGRYAASDGGVDGSTATCELCDPGYFCVDGEPEQCLVGTYSAAGQSACTNCASGLFQLQNASSTCVACPGGYECPDAVSEPVLCSAGTWSTNGSSASCEDCPLGYSCPDDGMMAPTPCGRGTYATPVGRTVCTTCPEGSSCISPAEDPVTCDTGAGEYSPEGDAVCHPCPEGFQCSGGALGARCDEGEYSNAGDDTCSPCGSGRACPNSTSASFAADGIPCPPGYVAETSAEGVAECVLCPADYECPTELLSDATLCASGTFSLGGAVSCAPCPAGFACSPSLSACTPGTTSLEGEDTCTPCVAGELCIATGVTAATCPDGTYSEAEAVESCQPCLPGYTCANGTLGSPCPEGQIVVAQGGVNLKLECAPCPAGFACPVTDPTYTLPCEEGFYSTAGATNCTVCPAGYYCPSTNVSAPIPCPTSDDAMWSNEGSVQCHYCPAGYECPTQDAVPILCAPGSYSSFRNTSCWTCPAGEICWSPDHSAQENISTSCPPGYFSEVNASSCTACSQGTFVSSFGASECTNCTAGRFTNGLAASGCLDCPAGHVCPLGQPPSMCARGQYNLGGTFGQSACVACDPGYLCTPGSTSKNPASDECPRGFFCPIVTSGWHQLQTAPVTGGRVVQLPCPAGKYGNITGAGSEEEGCVSCPGGFYCLPAAINDTWWDCPRGFYCEEGSAEPAQCPAGTYSISMNVDSLAGCLDCPNGTFCLPGYEPRNCPAGYWCEAGDPASATVIHGALTMQTPGACPAGYYSGEVVGLGANGDEQCMKCPPGSYCPGGLHANWPLPCPAGTYGPATETAAGLTSNTSCSICPAGWACPFPGRSRVDVPCYEGYYCPPGTVFPNENPCPAGTYSELSNATEEGDCVTCPEFKACLEGTGGARGPPDDEYVYGDATNNLYFGSGWIDCALGYFCPEGTEYPTQFACPAGTWSNRSRASCSGLNASGHYNPDCDHPCYECPPGMYCDGSGVDGGSGDPNIEPDGPCDAGYYCPAFSSSPQQESCPSGTYSTRTNLSHSEECDDCLVGHYCPSTQMTTPTECDPGEFQNLTGTTECTTCHAGYYCESSATVNEEPCGVGFYSADGATVCIACTEGYYCPSNTTANTDLVECAAGMYCPEGTAREPDFDHDACDAGYYCEAGSYIATQDPCPAGTYNPFVGLRQESDCLTCPMGYYCEEASTEPTDLCDEGYYCEAGSTTAQQDPCPAGTYNAFKGAGSIEACADCPPGYRCAQAASAPDDCGLGQYCPLGSTDTDENLCPEGTYGGSDRQNIRRSEECFLCPGGLMCPAGIIDPDDAVSCTLGSYCPEGSYYGNRSPCPRGHYCVTGSTLPEPCPPGKFNDGFWGNQSSHCESCTPGYYCEGFGNEEPDGLCSAGYFCAGGSIHPNDEIAQPGYFTLEGASSEEDCLPGEYQPNEGQSTCLECPAGYYCPSNNVYSPTECPQGSYCEAGVDTPTDCPEGTYGATTKLDSLLYCTPCPAGYYCDGSTPAAPSGECSEGYFCPTGSITALGETVVNSDPDFPMADCASDDVQDRPCPSGNYCPTASEVATACPPGTYLPTLSGVSSVDCIPCPNGTFCENQALPENSGQCDAGFYCHRNVLNARPTNGLYTLSYDGQELSAGGDICPAGSYCPVGSENPIECPAGKYSSTQGLSDASVCTPCSAGFFCPPGSSIIRGTLECPLGRYCPKETEGEWVDGVQACPDCPRCPAGTFGSSKGLKDSSECSPCPGGRYCSEGATPDYSGNCSAGIYCPAGAVDANDGLACPPGHFCPEGSSQPTPCPAGTFAPTGNLESEEDCTPCSNGAYCREEGLATVSGQCSAGYFCNGSATHPYQFPAPPGTFTDDGASEATNCVAGSYNNFEGSSSCTACPDRYDCPQNGTVTPIGCPTGFYCASGVTSPCPVGKYSDRQNLTSEDECTDCDEGFACTTTGLTAPNANCSAGFFCAIGSTSVIGQTIYCDETAGDAGRACEEGFYCPEATQNPVPCPSGLFGGAPGLSSVEECSVCPAAMACEGVGLRADELTTCGEGFFCLNGSVSANPTELYTSVAVWDFEHPSLEQNAVLGGGECPQGYYCPAGSALPEVCPPGTLGVHTSLSQSAQCAACPEGYYCPGNTTVNSTTGAGLELNNLRLPCPVGSYCAANSTSPTLCPAGKFGALASAANETDCVNCPGGRYCEEGSIDIEGSGPCALGYYCIGGAATPTPTDNVTGAACLDGYYCGEGSVEPQPCRGGKFCVGQPSPTLGNCSAGYYCTSASSTATPVRLRDFDGDIMGDECWVGFYCPEASVTPIACPAGKYNDVRRAESEADCLDCPSGNYCPLAASNSSMFEPCPAKFYCPEGTAQVYENSCPVGHYCTGSNSEPTHCPEGTYQDLPQQSECKTCPAGYGCGNATEVPEPCPRGRYCEAGTLNGQPCPAGKFGNLTYLEICFNCTEGWLCTQEGLYEPDQPCPAGYYCAEGASEASDAEPCPPGTYSSTEGLAHEHQCLHCPAGQYCEQSAMTSPSGVCDGGYYCEDGSSASDQIQCSAGTFCPAGSSVPIICPMGHFCETGSADSTACAAGSYNNNLGSTASDDCIDCPIGHYCPEASEHPVPCALGTYTTSTGANSSAQCTLCPAGSYCFQDEDVRVQLPCLDGFYCPGGDNYPLLRCPAGHFCPNASDLPTPCDAGSYQAGSGADDCSSCPESYYCPVASVLPQPCPQGYACEAATASPEPCPVGFFTNRTDLTTVEECDICPEGHYCPTEGLAHPLPCDAGFYCRRGSTSSSPTDCDDIALGDRPGASSTTFNSTCLGGTCLAGYYCPEGSVVPTGSGPCPIGAYCPAATPEILTCEAGFIAPVEGAVDCLPCPAGHFCNTTTRAYECVETTYNPNQNSVSEDDCLPCSPGYQCESPAFEEVPCTAGYYCPSGVERTICPERFYCPQGSYEPLECDVEHFCPEGSVAQTVCPPGYYCADTWTGLDSNSQGSASPVPCPNGTYSPLPSQTSQFGCITCAGGYYCPEGSSGQVQCMEGFYCPVGSSEPIPCPSAATCPLGSSSPIDCEAGYYCPEGTGANAILCPVGSYCESPASEPTLCPNGTADADPTRRTSEDTTCALCAPGTAGSHPNREECLPCAAGHVCSGPGTLTTTPVSPDDDLGYVCPAGHYCGPSSVLETPCPAGTYSDTVGATTIDTCLPCDENHFTNIPGQTVCLPCGSTSTSNASSTTCSCIGKNRVFQSHVGMCRCRAGFTDTDTAGNAEDGITDCFPIAIPPRCAEGEIRDSLGACRSVSDCDETCLYGGERQPSGLCACEAVQSPSSVCGGSSSDCIDDLPKYWLDKLGALHITADGDDLNISDHFTTRPNPSVNKVYGKTSCPTSDGTEGHCGLTPIATDSRRMSAMFQMGNGTQICQHLKSLANICGEGSYDPDRRRLEADIDFPPVQIVVPLPEAANSLAFPDRRRLEVSCTSNGGVSYPGCPSTADCDRLGDGVCDNRNNEYGCGWDAGDCTGIENAIICKQVGEGVLFDLPNSVAAPIIPIYDENSTLNTNSEFDYSEFLQLEQDQEFCFDKELDDDDLDILNGTEFANASVSEVCTALESGGFCANRYAQVRPSVANGDSIDMEAAYNATIGKCCACSGGDFALQRRWFAFTFDTPGTYVFTLKYQRETKIVVHITNEDEECASSLGVSSVLGNTINSIGATDAQQAAEDTSAKDIDEVLAVSVIAFALIAVVFYIGLLACFKGVGLRRQVWEQFEIYQGENPRSDIANEFARDIADQKKIGVDHLPPAPQELTADEIDQLMKRLEGLDVLTDIGFRQQHKVIDAALNTMQAEADTMRDMLAKTIFSGSALDKKIMLSKQVGAELDGRQINTHRYVRTLHDVLEAIDNIEQFLAQGINYLASTTLDEFLDSFEGGTGDFDRDEEITGRSIHFSEATRLIETGVQSISRLKSLFVTEKGRCMQTQALFDAARYAEILDANGGLSKSIDTLFDTAEATDIHRQDLMQKLDPFAAAIKQVHTNATVVSDRFTEANFAAITNDANPAVFASIQKEFVVKYCKLLEELEKCLSVLHHGVPQIEDRIHSCHEKQTGLVEDLKNRLNELKREIKSEQDSIERAKLAKNRELGGNIAAMAMAMPVMRSLMMQTRYHASERKKLHENLQAEEMHQLASVDRRLQGLVNEQLIDHNAAQLEQKAKQDAVLQTITNLPTQSPELKDIVISNFSADQGKLERVLELERQKRQEALQTRLGARKLMAESKVSKRQSYELQELALLQEHNEKLQKLNHENESELLEQDMRLREEQMMALSAEEQKAQRLQARLMKSLDTTFQNKLNDLQQAHVNDCVNFFEIPSSDRQQAHVQLKERMAGRARRKEEKIAAELIPQIQALEAQLAGGANGGEPLSDVNKLKLSQQKAALVASLEARISAAKEESEAESAQVLARQLKDDVDYFNGKLAGHSAKGRKILSEYQRKYDELMKELQMEKDHLAANIKAETEAKKKSVKSAIEQKKQSAQARIRDDHLYDLKSLEKQHMHAANDLQTKLESSSQDWWWQDSLQEAIKAAKDEDHDESAHKADGVASPNPLLKQHELINNLLGQKKAELRSMDSMLDMEKAVQLEKIEAESEAELQQARKANAAQLEKLLKAANGDAAAEKRIREQIKQDEQKQEMVQAATRRRKKAALLHRQKEKRRKARQAAETEINREREALEQAQRTKEFDLEMEVLQEAIAAGKIPPEKVAQAIESALQPRHDREIMALSTRQFERKAKRIADVLQDVASSKQAALSALMKNFQDEPDKHTSKQQQKLVKELVQRFDEMEQKEMSLLEEEMAELEKKERFNMHIRHEDEIVQGYFRCAPDDVLESYQQLAAKRRAADIKDFKKSLLADKQQRIKRVQQQQALHQERLMEQQQAELAHLQTLYDDELSRMKMSLDEKLAHRQVQMQRERQLQLEETIRRYEQQQQARQHNDDYSDSDISAAVDRIRQSFDKDTERINRALINEKRRQESAMEQKLLARQTRQMRFKQELLLNQMKDMDEAGKAKIKVIEESTKEMVLEKMNQVNQLAKKVQSGLKDRGAAGLLRVASKMNLWAKRSKEKASKRHSLSPEARREERLKKESAQRAQHHIDTTSATNRAAANRLLNGAANDPSAPKLKSATRGGKAFKKAFAGSSKKKDPLEALGDLSKVEQRLDSIHGLLQAVVGQAGAGENDDTGSYVDVSDLSLVTEGVLKESPEAATAETVVAARILFAHAIAERCGLNIAGSQQASLAVNKSKPTIRLVLADTLPHNKYQGNAYRHSVFFDDETRSLFLRMERFRSSSSGDLMVFLVHCFSHVVASGKMFPDSNAVFQANLHNSLRQCGKLISALSRNAHDFSAAERVASGSSSDVASDSLAESGPVLKSSVADLEALVKASGHRSQGGRKTAPPPPKGSIGQKRELAEQLDGAEAAHLFDLKTVREYSRAIDELEKQLNQPAVADDRVQFTLLQGKLNQLKVKYENAQETARRSRAQAADLQKAYQECPDDPKLNDGLSVQQRQSTKRALTMAADAVANLSEYLTPR